MEFNRHDFPELTEDEKHHLRLDPVNHFVAVIQSYRKRHCSEHSRSKGFASDFGLADIKQVVEWERSQIDGGIHSQPYALDNFISYLKIRKPTVEQMDAMRTLLRY